MHLSAYLLGASLSTVYAAYGPIGSHPRFHHLRESPLTTAVHGALSQDAPHLMPMPRYRRNKWYERQAYPMAPFGSSSHTVTVQVPTNTAPVAPVAVQSAGCPYKQGKLGAGCPYKLYCPQAARLGVHGGCPYLPTGHQSFVDPADVQASAYVFPSSRSHHRGLKPRRVIVIRQAPPASQPANPSQDTNQQQQATEKPSEGSNIFSDEEQQQQPHPFTNEGAPTPVILQQPKPSNAGRTFYDQWGNLVGVSEYHSASYPRSSGVVYAPTRQLQRVPRLLAPSRYKWAGKTHRLSHRFLKPGWRQKTQASIDQEDVQNDAIYGPSGFLHTRRHAPTVYTAQIPADEVNQPNLAQQPILYYSRVAKKLPKYGRTFVY